MATVIQESVSRTLLDAFLAQRPLRTGSLIVTIFGDAIAPRGGTVWLGSLIDALAQVGIGHRLVRTAAYRLVQDNLLANVARGRRSFYSLTPSGREAFAAATGRIYAAADTRWDGRWTLLLLQRVPADARAQLRKTLRWAGFATVGTDLLAHPRADAALLTATLAAQPPYAAAVVMHGSLPAAAGEPALALVRDAWDLPTLESAYLAFLKRFQPLSDRLDELAELSPADAFYVRTFLIHEYRKVLLRDPALPPELLPADWPGRAAYELTRILYRAVVRAAELFVDNAFQTDAGPLPPPDKSFCLRFGGL